MKRLLRNFINFLDRDLIDFIVNVEAFDVLSVPLDNINELINVIVSSKSDMSIMQFILVQNILHQSFINLG
jgi:hypothetical protein